MNVNGSGNVPGGPRCERKCLIINTFPPEAPGKGTPGGEAGTRFFKTGGVKSPARGQRAPRSGWESEREKRFPKHSLEREIRIRSLSLSLISVSLEDLLSPDPCDAV